MPGADAVEMLDDVERRNAGSQLQGSGSQLQERPTLSRQVPQGAKATAHGVWAEDGDIQNYVTEIGVQNGANRVADVGRRMLLGKKNRKTREHEGDAEKYVEKEGTISDSLAVAANGLRNKEWTCKRPRRRRSLL
ncbi:hypothetical protein Dda_6179 [Drechslerella dactyloides]|uniref:Uncharacterized protein n=1 Tax=Drechslerella dactyloides TaxID=74499 RepID=A0AAD6IV47_DREDA|nr:hypothetical protein Dda_6179 [Drechslerella dactyloides]